MCVCVCCMWPEIMDSNSVTYNRINLAIPVTNTRFFLIDTNLCRSITIIQSTSIIGAIVIFTFNYMEKSSEGFSIKSRLILVQISTEPNVSATNTAPSQHVLTMKEEVQCSLASICWMCVTLQLRFSFYFWTIIILTFIHSLCHNWHNFKQFRHISSRFWLNLKIVPVHSYFWPWVKQKFQSSRSKSI